MDEALRIAVIEDEVAIRRFLRASMQPEEAEWLEAETAEQGLRLVATQNPDVVLLDLGLPDMDGLDALRAIRQWSSVPVIVLTAKDREADKVVALDTGADDYVTKPFSLPELLARIRVALRHSKLRTVDAPVVETKGLRVDFARRLVHLEGNEVRLTPTEYRLLALLVRHAGRVVTQSQLLREVWGDAYGDATHTLRVHMAALRQKIEPDATHPRFIRTETGVGYRFLDD